MIVRIVIVACLFSLFTVGCCSPPESGQFRGDDLVAAVTNRVHVPQSPEAFAYDANGNQTLVETPSGRWAVEWNAENRPVRWTCGDRVLLMSYDHMGRRVRYVEITGGVTNKVATFLHDDYLCQWGIGNFGGQPLILEVEVQVHEHT